MNKFLLAILFVLVSFYLPAQTLRKTSEDISIEMYDSYPSYPGTLSYSYTVDDNGNRIKNGPISITGSLDETYGYGYMYVKIKGSYNLSGACKKDEMDGPFSVNAKYHFVVKQGSRGGSYDEEYKMKGSFVEGLPNGNFTASITDVGSVNVNYNNGVLVGSYFVDAEMKTNTLRATIKGNLDKNGQMIGKWEYSYLGDYRTMEFINGILINESRRDTRTVIYKEASDSQIELAKQYATGAITESELKKHGAIIKESSLPLGDFASDIFYRQRLVTWRKMGKCYFGNSENVKYKYLSFYEIASESELDPVFDDYMEKGYSSRIKYDSDLQSYLLSSYDYGGYLPKRLTTEHINIIKESLDYYNRHNVLPSFMWYLNSSYNKSFSNSSELRGISDRFANLQKYTDLSKAEEDYNSMINILNQFDTDLSAIQKTPDGAFYIMPYDGPLSSHYVASSSLEEFLIIEKNIRDYVTILPDNVAREQEKHRQKLESDIRSVLNMMVEASTYGKIIKKYENYFVSTSSWANNDVSIYDFLTAVCPVIGYELIDFNETTTNSSIIVADVNYIKKTQNGNIKIPVTINCKKDNNRICSVSLSKDIIEQSLEDYRNEAGRLLLENIKVEDQKAKPNEHVQNLISIKENYGVYYNVNFSIPKEAVSVEVLPYALYPCIDISLLDIKNEDDILKTYRVTISVKKKQKRQVVSFPITMSINSEGSIIENTVVIPDDLMEIANKAIKKYKK